MSKSNEKLVLNAIVDYLTLRRVFFWRNNTGAFKTEHGGFYRFGMPGSPDICVIKNGHFIGLEVKDKGKLSGTQIDWGNKCIEAGGAYWVVRCIEDVQDLGL